MNKTSKFAAGMLGGLLALCSLLPQSAAAESIAACREIAAASERLACYDRAAGRDDALVAPTDSRSDPTASPASHGTIDPSALRVTRMQEAWGILGDAPELFRIRPYRPIYLLPVFVSSRVNSEPSSPALGSIKLNDLEDTEAKFQLSFKTQLASNLFGDNGDLWVGYTQSSRWQVFSPGISRPFRETNYEPEAMFVWKTDLRLLGIDARYVGIGVNHESNGRANPLSRSWNRIIGQVGLERGDWTTTLRLWKSVGDADNPDITDHMGHGDVLVTRDFGAHRISATLRPAFIGGSSGKGALRLDWAFPISGQLRGHVQAFIGRGESLIDYNHFTRSIGVGVSLVEW